MAIKPIEVSQLNQYIGSLLKTDPILGNVLVRGEISNLKYHSSGNIYFSLKDDNSTVGCFLSRTQKEALRYQLEDGMAVICSGHISVYQPGGRYNLQVRTVEAEGEGDLAKAFGALKAKLEKKGYFDPEKKQPLPAYPDNIAIVTSETGAAIRDMLKIIKSRSTTCSVTIYPVLVQGRHAAGDIARAIDDINQTMDGIDVIICGRGGGSTEDLWAFNEEVVADAIYHSKIPIVSAVGHETDFTIADFVADRRAETPTAAAQMVVPMTEDIQENLKRLKEMLQIALEKKLEYCEKQLSSHNMDVVEQLIKSKVHSSRQQLLFRNEAMDRTMEQLILEKQRRLEVKKIQLEGISPYGIMDKGYVAITDATGRFITSIGNLQPNQQVYITGADGAATAVIREVSKNEKENI